MAVAQISKSYLLAHIEQGASMSALCALTDLSMDKLKALLETHGIVVEKHGARKLPPAAELVERIEQGQHPKAIGAAFGVSASAVHAALSRVHLSARDIRRGLHKDRSSFGMPSYAMQIRGSIDHGDGK